VVDARQGLRRAEPRDRIWVRAVERRVELVERARRGVVAALLDPAHEPVTLAVDFSGGELRLERQLGGEPEQLAPEARQRRRADLGVVHVALRAELAAKARDRLRELRPAAPGGAPDHYRVHEVRDPGVGRILPPRAHLDEQRHGDHRRDRILAHQDREAVVEALAGLLCRGRRGQETGDQQSEDDPGHRDGASGTNRTRA